MFGLSGGYNSSNTNSTQNTTETGTNTSTGLSQALQDPLATAFRQGLFSSYNNAINKQQNNPLFASGLQSSFLGQQNQDANNNINTLKQALAGSGALDSGALSAGASNILAAKQNNQANFEANLPTLESQSIIPLLSGASQLAGQAPISTATSGNSSFSNLIDSILNSHTGGFSLGGSLLGLLK